MAKQNYVFYEKTSPFPGWIRMVGHVDPAQLPDGSTLAERLEQLRIKYPDADYKLFPLGDLLDPEAVKYDQASQILVPLEPGDITPRVQEALDQSQKAQDIITNLPSWTQVRNAIINAFPDPTQQSVILKLARALYWIAIDKKD